MQQGKEEKQKTEKYIKAKQWFLFIRQATPSNNVRDLLYHHATDTVLQ